MKTFLAAAVGATCVVAVHGHGYLTCPKPRQYRDVKPASWTHWMGITVPGDGSFNPGEGNAPNLNAGIGGGVANEVRGSSAGGHGLCGDIGGCSTIYEPYKATFHSTQYSKRRKKRFYGTG